MSMARIGFVSLGCAKATVDSERILSELKAYGYAFAENYESADLVIVNTCGFIESAVEESLVAISEAMSVNGQVIVTGCLGVRAEMLKKKFPQLLAITGPHDTAGVIKAVHEVSPPQQTPLYHLLPPGGVKLTPRHYAYLKISEGCNHKCTFCIIPSMRGRLVSRSPNDVVSEARQLRDAGVRELLVVSQDTSAYGIDLKGQSDLMGGTALRPEIGQLARELSDLDLWVRLHYVYPYPHVDRLVELMADGALLPYLDVPFQHASAKVLRSMKRPASGENNLERVNRWREICPELAIRSTFIVGFPGETEADFHELLGFLEKAQLDRVGCFTYSPVEGAKANALPHAVEQHVAQERLETLMELQAGISKARLAARIGSECAVLVDEVTEDVAVARSYAESPDVDGVVYVENPEGLAAGQMIPVRITDSTDHDLIAERVHA